MRSLRETNATTSASTKKQQIRKKSAANKAQPSNKDSISNQLDALMADSENKTKCVEDMVEGATLESVHYIRFTRNPENRNEIMMHYKMFAQSEDWLPRKSTGIHMLPNIPPQVDVCPEPEELEEW